MSLPDLGTAPLLPVSAATRIRVAAPADTVTGGPELLHQLVHELRRLGHDAAIAYYPFTEPATVPEPYERYDVPVAAVEDDPDTLLVIPEVATGLLRSRPNTTAVVWWLSIDNYLGRKRESAPIDLARRLALAALGRRVPLPRLRPLHHLAQSDYAVSWLADRGVTAHPLGDYLNASHLGSRADGPREDLIVFNPAKGRRTLDRVRAANPDLTFVPIQNMTPAEVADLLGRAKLYVDFGHHPGKDRMPREAAIAGCCVVTGRLGSAGSAVDVPIPHRYKLDDDAADLGARFGDLARQVLADHGGHSAEFDRYREIIAGEADRFGSEVAAAFGPA